MQSWGKTVRLEHPVASHDVVQVGVGQEHLCWSGFQPETERLERLSFFPVCHARVHDGEFALTVLHDVSLFSKAIACEGMHHEA